MYGNALGRLPIESMVWVAGRPVPPIVSWLLRRYLAVFGYPSVAAHLLHPMALGLLGLQPTDCLLDAGCGKGLLTTDRRVANCRSYCGIDAVPSRVRHAAQLASRLARRVGFATMDMTTLGFQSESFDKVVCLEVIEHVEEDANALRELCRVLRPGGRLVLSTSVSDASSSLPVAVQHRDHARDGYSREDLEQKIAAAGFVIDEWRPFRGARANLAFRIENTLVTRGLQWTLPVLFPLLWSVARTDRVGAGRSFRGQLVLAIKPTSPAAQ